MAHRAPGRRRFQGPRFFHWTPEPCLPREGSFNSALQEFKTKFAPHFLVGAGRIIQFAPLGIMSHALEHKKNTVETNRWARVQIEVAAKSKLDLWQLDDATFDTLASLLAVLEDAAHIPLKRHWPEHGRRNGDCRYDKTAI
jgi:hypothetical protein